MLCRRSLKGAHLHGPAVGGRLHDLCLRPRIVLVSLP